MTTLYFYEEVNLNNDDVKYKISDKELNLAIKLIESMKSSFDPKEYKDEYQDNIKVAINNKIDGKKIKKSKSKNKKEISDLMEALEKSLNEK